MQQRRTDAELETGRAKTIFLRVIQPLRFPGATTTPVTNLMVQTVDARGQNRLYTFDIVHSSNPRYVGVQILPAIARSQPSPVVNNLNTAYCTTVWHNSESFQRG
jgi:hypothetical protein